MPEPLPAACVVTLGCHWLGDAHGVRAVGRLIGLVESGNDEQDSGLISMAHVTNQSNTGADRQWELMQASFDGDWQGVTT